MLLNTFETYLKNQFNLKKEGCKILIAVSGGVDSVVLTNLFFKAGYNFETAHCNFQLRSDESMRDEEFVLNLGKKYENKVHVKRFETKEYAAAKKMSIQEAARQLRYEWFKEIVDSWEITEDSNMSEQKFKIQNSKFKIIATAHNSDDNIETLLINFFRGTGISGLHGIPAMQNNIIRPLLFASRNEIELYAKENNLQWVEDSSNKEDKYTRNFFRLNLLPQLQNIFPSVKENLLQNIERFAEAETLYRQAIDVHLKKLVTQKGNEFHIPILLLQKTKPVKTILWEIIKPYNFSSSQTDEIIKLLDAENSSHVSSATHRIIKNRKHLIIAPLETKEAGIILIEEGDKQIEFDAGKIFISLDDAKDELSNDANIACLDASKISFPLLLRKWKQGDYFYPLGMNKKKKLSKFFIDRKLSSTQKENVWVIEMDKKIIWIVGQRIDDRFKVLHNSKTIMQIKFQQ